MTVKSKFKPGEIVYYKYPSRYSRSRDKNTVEAILQIKANPEGGAGGPDHYIIAILKSVRGDMMSQIAFLHRNSKECMCDSVTIETYCRRLTPAETVLYGSNGKTRK